MPTLTSSELHSLPWIERLVRFNTTSRLSNLGLIETVRDDLRREGLEVALTYDASSSKANLFATIAADDGRLTGGTVLSGHTDVVPVDNQAWDTDPFEPVIRDGKLFARGSADMKGFIGVVLSTVPRLKLTRLKNPVHIALTYDEEVGCFGAVRMLEDLQARQLALEGCIVGEPTNMRAIVAHKGISVHRCSVHGRAAHASLTPNGVNAIEYAARLICHIRAMADRFRAQGPFDPAFDVPFSTAQTGTITGGSAPNIVPDRCEFLFEVRSLPTLDHDELIRHIYTHARDVLVPEMRLEHESAAIVLSQVASAPGLDASEKAAITQLVRDLTGDRAVTKVAYATEAGLFEAAGIPAIICGPGDIEQAHKPNEFVALDQIAQCEAFMQRFVFANSRQAQA